MQSSFPNTGCTMQALLITVGKHNIKILATPPQVNAARSALLLRTQLATITETQYLLYLKSR